MDPNKSGEVWRDGKKSNLYYRYQAAIVDGSDHIEFKAWPEATADNVFVVVTTRSFHRFTVNKEDFCNVPLSLLKSEPILKIYVELVDEY